MVKRPKGMLSLGGLLVALWRMENTMSTAFNLAGQSRAHAHCKSTCFWMLLKNPKNRLTATTKLSTTSIFVELAKRLYNKFLYRQHSGC